MSHHDTGIGQRGAREKEPLSVTVERMRAIGGIPDNVVEQLQCIRACGGDHQQCGPDHEHFCPLFRETDTRKVVECRCGHKHVCDLLAGGQPNTPNKAEGDPDSGSAAATSQQANKVGCTSLVNEHGESSASTPERSEKIEPPVRPSSSSLIPSVEIQQAKEALDCLGHIINDAPFRGEERDGAWQAFLENRKTIEAVLAVQQQSAQETVSGASGSAQSEAQES